MRGFVYKVLEAGNGLEALEVIKAGLPDLALVDFNMPKMNGYELIQELRSDFETRKLRIIMFTGATNRQHLRTLNMDISDFLEKPVSNAKLLETITRVLGQTAAPVKANSAKKPPEAPQLKVEPAPPLLNIERFAAVAPVQVPVPPPQVSPARAPVPAVAPRPRYR